jgi:hypothetical protein
MPEKHPTWDEIERDRDTPVKLPLDPENALRGFLAVDPDSEPAGGTQSGDDPDVSTNPVRGMPDT